MFLVVYMQAITLSIMILLINSIYSLPYGRTKCASWRKPILRIMLIIYWGSSL